MIIRIKNLKVPTFIGVYETEKKIRQLLIVNLKIEYDEGRSPKSDKVADTLNYHPLCDMVTNYLSQGNFDLLEKVVEEIGEMVLKQDRVLSVEVEVDKPEAPIEAIDSVSVSKLFRKSAGWFPII